MFKKILKTVTIPVFLVCLFSNLFAQQINISRIEMMPNMPSPYEMRNWKEVALGYDSLVFDLNRSGQYLPLIFVNSAGVNYPGHQSFGLHTVVGTPYTSSGEAINVIPAVIGATLAGIDKSSQNGYNWALMCEDFFNKRPAEMTGGTIRYQTFFSTNFTTCIPEPGILSTSFHLSRINGCARSMR